MTITFLAGPTTKGRSSGSAYAYEQASKCASHRHLCATKGEQRKLRDEMTIRWTVPSAGLRHENLHHRTDAIGWMRLMTPRSSRIGRHARYRTHLSFGYRALGSPAGYRAAVSAMARSHALHPHRFLKRSGRRRTVSDMMSYNPALRPELDNAAKEALRGKRAG